MPNYEVTLVAKVDTGNIPLDAGIFKLLIYENDLPVWKRCGAYDVLNFIDIPPSVPAFPTWITKGMLVMCLVHMCAHPDVYISGIIVQNDVDTRMGQYRTAVRDLASLIEAIERYPNTKIIVGKVDNYAR